MWARYLRGDCAAERDRSHLDFVYKIHMDT